jgi:hypothetical protein
VSSTSSDPEPIDDDTVRIPRDRDRDAAPGVPSETDDLDATVLSRSAEPLSAANPDSADVPGPRRASTDDSSDPDDGSTMVARRETRRRAARDLEARDGDHEPSEGPVIASTRAADVPAPVRRLARSPEPSEPTYAARDAGPARVERTAPSPRDAQDVVDTAAADASLRARRRGAIIAMVVVALIIAVAAVTALVALTTLG